MSKLEEKFLNHINDAEEGIDCIKEPAEKVQAHIAIAQAVALYLLGITSPVASITTTTTASTATQTTAINPDAMNATVLDGIPDVVNDKSDEEWELQYDENGVPFLNDEDYSYPNRVIVYDAAMKALEGNKTAGTKNETEEPIEDNADNEPEVELDEETAKALAQMKEDFDYAEDPDELNMIVNNFSNGIYETLDEVDANTMPSLIDFVYAKSEEAYNNLMKLINKSYPGKEFYDDCAKQYFDDNNATVDEYIGQTNAYGFYAYAVLCMNQCYLENFEDYENSGLSKEILDSVAAELYDGATVDDINESTIAGFVKKVLKDYYDEDTYNEYCE